MPTDDVFRRQLCPFHALPAAEARHVVRIVPPSCRPDMFDAAFPVKRWRVANGKAAQAAA
jgi:hypothetical protein